VVAQAGRVVTDTGGALAALITTVEAKVAALEALSLRCDGRRTDIMGLVTRPRSAGSPASGVRLDGQPSSPDGNGDTTG
jgi:hypothetical protein